MKVSVGLQGSFSWSRTHSSALSACFQLVFSFYSFIRLYKSSRITLLSYGISQLNTVIFNPCFATDTLRPENTRGPADISPAARYRALYIAAARERDMIFNRILKDLGSDHIQAWNSITDTEPKRVSNGEGTASDQSQILRAMKLLIGFKDFDALKSK
jgi:hypothetical protein